MGAAIAGNTDCKTGDWGQECCFCKPNGVRSSQVRSMGLAGMWQGCGGDVVGRWWGDGREVAGRWRG